MMPIPRLVILEHNHRELEPELARNFLNYYSGTEALKGMRLADDLAAGIEARTRAIYGIRSPRAMGNEKD